MANPRESRDSKTEESGPREGLVHHEQYPSSWMSPFAFMRRFSDEMDRLFEGIGRGRGGFGLRFQEGEPGQGMWSPSIEAFQRGDELVIRAELPGLSKDDIKIEVHDEELTIQGERRQEHKEERGGFYRSERSYGSFYRTIPLPEGARAEAAKASFRDGVLEVVIPAPHREASRGRRIAIQDVSGAPSSGVKPTPKQTAA
ncbi:MAG: Hsp20/alpha crystallin family protein [bacterium]